MSTMDRYMYYYIIVILLAVRYIQGQTYSLSGSAPYGIRGGDYSFTCQISGGNLINTDIIEFKKDNNQICTRTLNCNTGSSSDPTRYTCGCMNGNNRQLYLNITNVTSTDAGTWTCGDSFNTRTSPPVTLPVYYGPENIRFTPTSSNITVIENESRNITCSADCNPPPCNINWYKGSETSGNIISSSNGRLQLNNIQRQDTTYTCQAKHRNLTTTPLTKTLQITVYYGPENIRFTPTSSSITVIENESRNVICSADCNPQCNINWYTGSTIISSTELLSLNNIQRQQAGNYTCQVTNTRIPGSLQSKQLMVIVHYPPTITSLTSNATNNMIDEDSTVTFTCSVDSLPSSVISWSRSQQREQLYSGSQYTISEASCQHTDNYTCTASNNIGQPVSKTIPLYVRCYPRENMATKRNITNRINTAINLQVDIIAYPRPTFTWYHTSTRQIINTARTQQLSTINYKSTVEITLNSTLFGDYIVSVVNGIGVQNFTITVIDGDPPVNYPVESNNIPTIVGSIIGVLMVIGIVVVIGVVIYRRKASRNNDNTYDGLGITSLSTNQPVYDEINSSTTRSNDTTARADSTPAYYNTTRSNDTTARADSTPVYYNTTNLNHSDITNPQYVNSPSLSSTYDGLDARSKKQHPDIYQQLNTSSTPYEGQDVQNKDKHQHCDQLASALFTKVNITDSETKES
ncbi:hemicentin-1 isoform X6 [Patella vulgata]|uniref:hemicentin-1 isoform X6 n=1 Tax=Patella vulgata TaxID=6465 RepID=UPI0024A8596A|nr:hemicentin-1 isoform X6 [Patella vulgata]